MKVLIVRFSSIGDIVLTSPVVRCLKQQTGAEVHFLTKTVYSGLLTANPYVDKVWMIAKDVSEVLRFLQAEAFDHVVDLHQNLRTTELRTRLALNATLHLRPRPRWHVFDKLNPEKFLLVNFGIDRLPDVHIVDRYLAAVADLGVVSDRKGLDYFVPENQQIDLASERLPRHYLVFVIGAAHATKRLTEEQIIAFCAAFPHSVLLVGGPDERATGDRIAAGRPHVHNTCGRFRLGGSADLIRQATVVVTHDTGMMHVAAAFRKPIISVWGNTVPAFGMYPYLPGERDVEKQRRQEVTGLSCRPCSKIGHQRCPKGHFRCIRQQDPADIVARAESLFNP